MSEARQRWTRVKALFESALAQPPGERDRFLQATCGSDGALREDVRSLLEAHAAAGSFAEGDALDALGLSGLPADDGLEAALATGTEFGPYRILAPLDAGGMGEVYRALDTRLHREVAVKVLPAGLADDPGRVTRLAREARLLAALSHPHIATVHGLEMAGGRQAIVMELVEGPTLADRLRAGPLPVAEALAIARQIADALAAAHDKGIVHRDLTPANVKLTAGGRVKVLDFGLATDGTGAAARADATAAAGRVESRGGLVAGTPGYMSPEQARGAGVDARADIWAFGCLVYELLAGRPAFPRHRAGDPSPGSAGEPDWTALPTTLPSGVRRMLRRCLQVDPARRLHSIVDARLEIDETAGEPDPGDPSADVRRRLRLLRGTTALLAVCLIALAGAWLVREPAAAPERRVVEITTAKTQDPWSFAISPDGRRLAFVADHEGQPTLWIRALDAAEARAVPGTTGARRPFWSPDSRHVGFFSNSELRRVDASGGGAQTVCYLLAGTNATWGPDGTILFSSTASPALQRVAASGGVVDTLPGPYGSSTGYRHPSFLPDGRQFLFFAGGPDDVRGVFLGALGSSTVTRLVASDTQGAYAAPGWLLFGRQGTLWAQRLDLAHRTVRGEALALADAVAYDAIEGIGAFSVSAAGVMSYRAARPAMTRLAWFDRSGRPLATPGSSEQAGLINVRLSPDGRRIAAERSLRGDTDLWLLDASHQVRFTHASNGGVTRLPVWSPTGDRLLFEAIRGGTVALAVKPVNGDGAEETLVASPEVKVPCDWSPDGRSIVYYVPHPKTGTDLWVLPLETRVPYVWLRTDANELWGQFSPDGRWLAYQSNETGRYEIYVRPFAGGGSQPISTGGGVYPRWARDGRTLYFIAPDAMMMAVAVRATATALDVSAPTGLFPTQRLGGGSNVIGRGHQFDVDREGRFLVNVDAATSAPPITLLLNWALPGS